MQEGYGNQEIGLKKCGKRLETGTLSNYLRQPLEDGQMTTTGQIGRPRDKLGPQHFQTLETLHSIYVKC